MKAKVSEKGQVTIPKAVRDRLGIRPGTVLEFAAEAGRLVARKSGGEDPFTRWKGTGKVPKGMSVDAYLSEVRG